MIRRFVIALGIVLLISVSALGSLHYYIGRYDHIIGQAAARNGVDFYLVKALIFEESWFRPQVRGAAGELGLMQITMAAASDYASQKGFPQFNNARLVEPDLNVEIGCWYLRRSIEHYKSFPQPIIFALLRYNAGEVRADHWLKLALSNPPPPGTAIENYYLSLVDFPKTRAYVRRILQRSRTHNYWY
jgi:soluble lytic murein transglycosylase